MQSKFALVALAAASFLTIGSATASAASSEDVSPRGQGCTTDGDCAGVATFHPDGEILDAHDRKSDGYGVYVQYWRGDTGNYGQFTNTQGSDTIQKKNLDIPEGTEFSFYVCLYEHDGSTHACSGWIYDVA